MEALAVAAKLISGGFCLGIGFWASKKLTNLVDEKLFIYDRRKMRALEVELGVANG